MRTVLRRSLIAVGLLVGLAFLVGALMLWVLLYGTPSKVDTMATRQFVQYLREDPEVLTQLGFVDGGRLDFHSGKLTNRSTEQRERRKRMIRDFREQLDRYNPEELPEDQKLTWEIWTWWLDTEIAASEPFFGAVIGDPYVVNQFGVQSALSDLFGKNHSLRNEKLARNFVRRLEEVDTAVAQTIDVFEDHADQGVMPPRFILERVISDVSALIEPRAGESPLVATFRARASESGSIDPSTLDDLEARAVRAVEDEIVPALRRFITVLDARLDDARVEQPGLIGIPGGADYYNVMIRRYTTTELDASELHELGLREVARLQAAILDEAEAQGFGDLSREENAERFAAAASYGLPDTEEGEAQLLAITEELIEEAREASGEFFARFPRAKVEVRPIPAHMAASANNSYTAPAADGSRPGYYNINVSNPSGWSSAGLPSLTYHEAIPGHHYQIALAKEIGIPVLRANLPFSAYTEGWALYAETIADEMGLYDENPPGRIGALRAELFRAIRLVVDTGLHAKGWSRDEAAEYMERTYRLKLSAEEEAEDETLDLSPAYSEIDRYIVRPGQALAYKVGEMEIARLRRKAEQALGDQFDIREFHTEVLSQGAMPMTILAARIDRWIESNRDREQN